MPTKRRRPRDTIGAPLLAIAPDDLGAKIGNSCHCHVCGETHRVRSWEGRLQTIECDGAHYLVGIDGRTWKDE